MPDLQFEEVDISRRPEVAVTYRVLATPAIAIDGKVEFVGVPKADALRARLLSAGP